MRLLTSRFLLAGLGFVAAYLGAVPAIASASQAGGLAIHAARDQEPAKPAPDSGDSGSDDSGSGDDEGSEEESD